MHTSRKRSRGRCSQGQTKVSKQASVVAAQSLLQICLSCVCDFLFKLPTHICACWTLSPRTLGVDGDPVGLNTVLYITAETLRVCALVLHPIVSEHWSLLIMCHVFFARFLPWPLIVQCCFLSVRSSILPAGPEHSRYHSSPLERARHSRSRNFRLDSRQFQRKRRNGPGSKLQDGVVQTSSRKSRRATAQR